MLSSMADLKEPDRNGMFASLKYSIAAILFWLVGALFADGSQEFIARSDPATLIVLKINSRRDADGLFTYRPVLALDGVELDSYAGNIWSRPAKHEAGDVVPGRYDPDSGEMRSDKMLEDASWIGRIAKLIAILVGIEALALLFGYPEHLLPIRVRGRRRRYYGFPLRDPY